MYKLKFFAIIGVALLGSNAYSAASIAEALPDANYTASMSWNGHNARDAFNGSLWISGDYGIQWLQVDLGSDQQISQVSFVTGQSPDGPTWEKVYFSDHSIGSSWGSMTDVASFSGYTTASTPLIAKLPNLTARFLQIVVDGGRSWTSLGRVSVTAVPEPDASHLAIAALFAMGIARKLRPIRSEK